MKKFNLKMAATVMICGSFLFSSCIGSFGLHSKLVSWNQGIGTKFVNELVYLAFNIIPVYGVCYLADALVINSIEFWSGSNPMASIGDVKKVKGENGDYLVETLENGYSITKEGETFYGAHLQQRVEYLECCCRWCQHRIAANEQ